MTTYPLSKFLLMFAALAGVFGVAEVVQTEEQEAVQNGGEAIFRTLIHELLTAVLAGALGFFLVTQRKSKNKGKLAKQQLKAKKIFYDNDSEASTHEGDSDGNAEADSDSDCAMSRQSTPNRSPASTPVLEQKMPPPMPMINTSFRMSGNPLLNHRNRTVSRADTGNWRQDAAAAQQQLKSQAPLKLPAASVKPTVAPTTGPDGMPSTLSAGGCALLQMLREERRSKGNTE